MRTAVGGNLYNAHTRSSRAHPELDSSNNHLLGAPGLASSVLGGPTRGVGPRRGRRGARSRPPRAPRRGRAPGALGRGGRSRSRGGGCGGLVRWRARCRGGVGVRRGRGGESRRGQNGQSAGGVVTAPPAPAPASLGSTSPSPSLSPSLLLSSSVLSSILSSQFNSQVLSFPSPSLPPGRRVPAGLVVGGRARGLCWTTQRVDWAWNPDAKPGCPPGP